VHLELADLLEELVASRRPAERRSAPQA
jgi:hypothetical protein